MNALFDDTEQLSIKVNVLVVHVNTEQRAKWLESMHGRTLQDWDTLIEQSHAQIIRVRVDCIITSQFCSTRQQEIHNIIIMT